MSGKTKLKHKKNLGGIYKRDLREYAQIFIKIEEMSSAGKWGTNAENFFDFFCFTTAHEKIKKDKNPQNTHPIEGSF